MLRSIGYRSKTVSHYGDWFFFVFAPQMWHRVRSITSFACSLVTSSQRAKTRQHISPCLLFLSRMCIKTPRAQSIRIMPIVSRVPLHVWSGGTFLPERAFWLVVRGKLPIDTSQQGDSQLSVFNTHINYRWLSCTLCWVIPSQTLLINGDVCGKHQ